MDISCERCRTEYEFDEARLTEAGVAVKCTTCGHVFRVSKAVVQGIRLRRGGQVLPSACPDVATLQRWIVESRILRTDEASVGGAPWRALGDQPEYAPFFALVDRASQPAARPGVPQTQQMLVPVGIATEPVLQPVAAPSAAATQQFRAFPPPGGPAVAPPPADAASTLQFRAPTLPASGPDAVSTAQYRVPMQPPTPHAQVTAALPMPRPSASPSTLEYRVPAQAPAPGVTAALALPAVTPPRPQPAAPEHPDAQATLRYRTPSAARVDVEGAPAATVNSQAPTPPRAVAPPVPVSPIAAARAGERPLPRPEFGDRDENESAKPVPQPPPAAPPRTERPKQAPTNERRPVAGGAKEPAWARSSVADDDGPDPEILAFQRRGRRARLLALAVVLLAALGAAFWFVVRPRLFAPVPPPEARAAFEQGRTLARAHALPQLAAAEKALREALRLAGPTPFAEAHGALAELACARAEQLLDAGDGPGAKAAIELAYAEAKAAHDAAPEGLAARRAFLDYFRTAGNPQKGLEQAPAVEGAAGSDPEAKAQLAALRAKVPATLAGAEQALAEVVAARPDLVRARWWLAQARVALKQDEAALEAMRGILALVPEHDRARAFVAARTPKAAPPPPVVEQPTDVPPPPVPEVSAAEPVPVAPPKGEPARVEPPKVEVAQPVAAKEPAKAEPAAARPLTGAEVDRLVAQAGRLLDRQKPQEALALYGQVIGARPDNVEAHYGRGVALFDLGRVDEAIEAFQRSLKLSPRFAASMIVLGDAYKTQGRNAEAVRWYQKYLEVLPDGEDAPAARANIARLQ